MNSGMFSKRVNFAASWSIIATAAALCLYLSQMLNIVSGVNNITYAESVSQATENSVLGDKSMNLAGVDHSKNINDKKKMKYEVTFSTNFGNFTIKLFNDKAPGTVENFVKLAQSGFYDGVKFHRVIKGFMIQAGDPLTKDDSKKDFWGTGGPGYTINDEQNDVKLVKGVLAMANTGRPNTGGSQFFIVTGDAPGFYGYYTPFGEVVSGMDVVTKIESVQTFMPGQVDRPLTDVVIQKLTVN